MTRALRSLAVCVACIALLTPPLAGAQRSRSGRHPFRYPMRCAGLTVGKSTDTDVQKLYGKGWFTPDEGHLGGRYFVDPKRTVTLHVEIGVDRMIDTVEYRQGVHLPRIASERGLKMATTTRLRADEPIQGGTRLGITTPGQAVARYGRPAKSAVRDGHGTLTYAADYRDTPEVLSYEAKLTFRGGRLVAVSLYNGE